MSKFKTRDIHQRRMSQVVMLIDTPLLYFKEFIELYEPTHPELAESAKVFVSLLITLQEAVQQFKRTF